jgi:hypothetical protein
MDGLRASILIATCAFTVGCVYTKSELKSFGLRVGDQLTLTHDAYVGRCKAEVSTTALWFGASEVACLSEKAGSPNATHKFPPSTQFRIIDIVFANGIDNAGSWLKIGANGESYWLEDLELPNLFGRDRKQ